ncbi:MAG: CoA-acylating methylmalonate-semialdehyde dehydrogenase [Planctomycetes bacterium]|jgi:malonate-semialdehyde dehydrogenase (acetylating)/methylmalonate-semialdehyde dehydrogenase|nr:CoA-acylating methylmalonate-semialdehyde dehydrogenase [Planctomycetota bacterium]MCP4840007.1 CoA-acylating methylmalonate-semialdehyde dehydrogenase [Planctomycetota bacterium]
MSVVPAVHVINGARVEAMGAESSFADINPATGEVLAQVPLDGEAAVDAAVRAAADAFPAWSATPVGERCQVLFSYKQVLESHFDELTDMIVEEHGKNVPEARGDVRRGIDCIEYACSAPSLMMGRTLPRIAVSSSFSRERAENIPLDSTMERVPLGVCAGITPFNFPIMVPMWMWPMAIACGNTFVLKPSEKVSLCAVREVELAKEAGLPDGVLNLVLGGVDASTSLITHEDVKAVSFVGSTPVARKVYATATAAGKRAQCMGGAKNCMIIMPDANREAAVDGVLGSAFGNTGQRCLAGSVAIPVGDAADWFVPAIVDAAKGIKTAAGSDADCGMGPLIDAASCNRVTTAIVNGVEEGADLLLDGREASMPDGDCFVGPTIFDRVTPGMILADQEIFGPVLSIMRRDTLDDAIEVTRQSPFGNMAVMFTSSGYAANRFRTEAGAGMIGINVGVPAPMAVFPFSGWKDSFFGSLHANGEDAVRFFTECRILVSRWF